MLAGSPAINAGTGCTVQVDQRYAPRDAQCDLGAFEFVAFTTVSVTIDPNTLVKQNGAWAVLTGTIKCSRSETFKLALELHQPQRVGKDVVDVHAAATEPIAVHHGRPAMDCFNGADGWGVPERKCDGDCADVRRGAVGRTRSGFHSGQALPGPQVSRTPLVPPLGRIGGTRGEASALSHRFYNGYAS